MSTFNYSIRATTGPLSVATIRLGHKWPDGEREVRGKCGSICPRAALYFAMLSCVLLYHSLSFFIMYHSLSCVLVTGLWLFLTLVALHVK